MGRIGGKHEKSKEGFHPHPLQATIGQHSIRCVCGKRLRFSKALHNRRHRAHCPTCGKSWRMTPSGKIYCTYKT